MSKVEFNPSRRQMFQGIMKAFEGRGLPDLDPSKNVLDIVMTRRGFMQGAAVTASAALLNLSGCGRTAPFPDVCPALDGLPSVDIGRIAKTIEMLSSDPRRIFTDGNLAAANYIGDNLKSYLCDKAKIEHIPFSLSDQVAQKYPGNETQELFNVVAKVPGTGKSKHIIIFCAHFDSSGEGIYNDLAPGANDNASGIAALLEIARIVGGQEFPFDIEFVAFNGEEQGLLGSYQYAGIDEPNSILAVVNLDTLGGNNLYDRLVLVSDNLSSKLSNVFLSLNQQKQIISELIAQNVNWRQEIDSYFGDHIPFWNMGIPALMISENSCAAETDHYPGNLYVHTADDTMDKMNMQTVAKAASLCLEFLGYLTQGAWRSFIRPKLNIPMTPTYQYLATIGGAQYFLGIQQDPKSNLPVGIFYTANGSPEYLLKLGFMDEFGMITRIGSGEAIGRLVLSPDWDPYDPVDLNGAEIISPDNNVISVIQHNDNDSQPNDIIAPGFEIISPKKGEPIMYFPGRAIRVWGKTEPGAKGEYFFMGPRNFQAAADGDFAFNLLAGIYEGEKQSFIIKDPAGNASTGEVEYSVYSDTDSIEGIDFVFLGAAAGLKGNPLLAEVATRLATVKAGNSYSKEVTFLVDPEQVLPLSGNSPLGARVTFNVRIDFPFSSNLEKALACVIIHESFHKIGGSKSIGDDQVWANLYEEGKKLGAWDLLDDSIIINYFPYAGHPKDNKSEGFASAGTAYTAFPETFRKIIEALALDECPETPFPENEALNRVYKIIFNQTPDRGALRQNLISIWNYIKDNYFNGLEFENNIR